MQLVHYHYHFRLQILIRDIFNTNVQRKIIQQHKKEAPPPQLTAAKTVLPIVRDQGFEPWTP